MRLTLLLGIIPVISIRRYQTGYELRLLNADDSASSKLINQGRHCARCGHRYVEGFGRVQTIRQQGGVQEAVARGVRAPLIWPSWRVSRQSQAGTLLIWKEPAWAIFLRAMPGQWESRGLFPGSRPPRLGASSHPSFAGRMPSGVKIPTPLARVRPHSGCLRPHRSPRAAPQPRVARAWGIVG